MLEKVSYVARLFFSTVVRRLAGGATGRELCAHARGPGLGMWGAAQPPGAALRCRPLPASIPPVLRDTSEHERALDAHGTRDATPHALPRRKLPNRSQVAGYRAYVTYRFQ
ncbi:unnamed protein product [Pieris macdunnoughi]|uniref:Uncharacterized protein n=1 Tax=Pieris macdunnoughi TaxID=345717 RepID=A0A821P519_9NEOP|nr:unnamed protein product [Pieris macdunnoughi]